MVYGLCYFLALAGAVLMAAVLDLWTAASPKLNTLRLLCHQTLAPAIARVLALFINAVISGGFVFLLLTLAKNLLPPPDYILVDKRCKIHHAYRVYNIPRPQE